jgi:hypothetical protein
MGSHLSVYVLLIRVDFALLCNLRKMFKCRVGLSCVFGVLQQCCAEGRCASRGGLACSV